MVTIFSVPRAFTGSNGDAQRNALRSWQRVGPDVEIVLFGDDDGVADAARAFGVRHEPAVVRNEFGTPLLHSVFARAEAGARHDRLCYVNADIILLPDFADAVRRIALRRFLAVGTRHDVDLHGPVDFDAPAWADDLRAFVRRAGVRVPPAGSDYFLFRRATIGPVPPFAVGRPRWDNWMIYNARRRRLAVIDASDAITAVHQNHDYAHWYGAPDGTLPEQERNQRLTGTRNVYTFEAATHRLTPRGVRRTWSYAHLRSRLKHAVRSLLPERLGGHPPLEPHDRAAPAPPAPAPPAPDAAR